MRCTSFVFTAVRGYFTLSHSNIDETDVVAVGGLTGKQFERRYKELASKEANNDYVCRILHLF